MQSIQWLQELIATVISRSNEVGESAMEADTLFLQLIQCKDAAEVSEISEIVKCTYIYYTIVALSMISHNNVH